MRNARALISLPNFIIVALAFLFLTRFETLSFDSFWHLALGRDIVTSHEIPTTETYSYTEQGQPLLVHSWLTDVLLYKAERWHGLRGAEVVAFFAITLLFFFHYRLARTLGASHSLSLLSLVIFATSSKGLLLLRPQLIGFLLLGILVWLYAEVRRGAANRTLYWILPLLTVWANFHGSFLLGVAFVGMLTVLEQVESYFSLSSADAARRGVMYRLCLLSVPFTLLNPIGWTLYFNAFAHDPFVSGIHQTINEWLQPNFNAVPCFESSVIVALVVLAFLRRIPALYEIVIFALTAHLGLTVWRHVPIYGAVGLPILASWLSQSLEEHASFFEHSLAATRRAGLRIESLFKGALSLAATLMIAIIVAGVTLFFDPRPDPLARKALKDKLPIDAVTWVKEHHPIGKLFNSFEWGGYLMYSLRDHYQVFIDSRLLPYIPIYREYLAIEQANLDAIQLLDRYKVDWVITPSYKPIVRRLAIEETWQHAYSDGVSDIFVRRSPIATPSKD